MRFMAKERLFWAEVLTIRGSASPLIMPRALLIGLFALLVTAVHIDARLPDLGRQTTSL